MAAVFMACFIALLFVDGDPWAGLLTEGAGIALTVGLVDYFAERLRKASETKASLLAQGRLLWVNVSLDPVGQHAQEVNAWYVDYFADYCRPETRGKRTRDGWSTIEIEVESKALFYRSVRDHVKSRCGGKVTRLPAPTRRESALLRLRLKAPIMVQETTVSEQEIKLPMPMTFLDRAVRVAVRVIQRREAVAVAEAERKVAPVWHLMWPTPQQEGRRSARLALAQRRFDEWRRWWRPPWRSSSPSDSAP